MKSTSIHCTVVQAAPAPRDLESNLARVRDSLAAPESDLLVFPELFLSGYQTAGLDDVALTLHDRRIADLARNCRASGTALIVGFVERGDHGYFDSMLAIDRDGSIRAPIRKTHLFGEERRVFLRGDELRPVTLCGVPVGVVNCFELEFPEVSRTLVLRGAAMLAAGSANMHPFEFDHRIAAISRALENRVPLAYANRIGTESGHRFCGSSRIIGRDGEVLAELDTSSSGSTGARIDLGRREQGATDTLSQRRPELYEA